MKLTLHVESEVNAVREMVVQAKQSCTVGSASDADLVIAGDTHLAAKHFTITSGAWECRLRHLGKGLPTFVNGNEVQDETLNDGDHIVAGSTLFSVHIEEEPVVQPNLLAHSTIPLFRAPASGSGLTDNGKGPVHLTVAAAQNPPNPTPPETPMPASPQKLTPPQQKLLQILQSQPEPVYTVLDAARDPSLLPLLQQSGEKYVSLYQGKLGEELAAVAPYLVALSPRGPFAEELVCRGWGNAWGIYLVARVPMKEVRDHLRHFLMVKNEDDDELYFRFYDPRVLRVFLPACTRDEAAQLVGPVMWYLLEDDAPDTLLQMSVSADGLKTEKTSLVRQPAGPFLSVKGEV